MRKSISYVPQDSSFFDNSITYNLSYFAGVKINFINIIAAAKAVEMHNEIMKLALCYDNMIMSKGLSLSGGQRQRLAVARAILGNPDILVLDEITANLDPINARKVNKSVLNLESSKTTVFITHDITEVVNSDFVIVLEDGKIVEQGNPQQLIKKKGKLYDIFKYKLGNRLKHSGKATKKELASFVKDYIIKENAINIKAGKRKSFVDVAYRGKMHSTLVPKKPFPVAIMFMKFIFTPAKYDKL